MWAPPGRGPRNSDEWGSHVPHRWPRGLVPPCLGQDAKVLLLGPLGRSLTPKTEGGSELSHPKPVWGLGRRVSEPLPHPCPPHGPSCRSGPPVAGEALRTANVHQPLRVLNGPSGQG